MVDNDDTNVGVKQILSPIESNIQFHHIEEEWIFFSIFGSPVALLLTFIFLDLKSTSTLITFFYAIVVYFLIFPFKFFLLCSSLIEFIDFTSGSTIISIPGPPPYDLSSIVL